MSNNNIQDWEPLVLHKKIKNPPQKQPPKPSLTPQNIPLDHDEAKTPTISLSAAKQIQQGRVNRGFSQEELARMLSVKTSIIKDYENGKAIPSRPLVNRLNRILEIVIKL